MSCRTTEEAFSTALLESCHKFMLAWDKLLRVHTRHKLAVPSSCKSRKAAGKALFVQIEVLRPHIWQQAWWQWRNYKGELHVCEPRLWCLGCVPDETSSTKLLMMLQGCQSKAHILKGRATQRRSPLWKGQHTVPMLCSADDGALCGVFIIGTSPCSDRAAVRCFAVACSRKRSTQIAMSIARAELDSQRPTSGSIAL